MLIKWQISKNFHPFYFKKGNYTEHHLNDGTILAQTDEAKDILITVSDSVDWTLWGWNVKWPDRSLDKAQK